MALLPGFLSGQDDAEAAAAKNAALYNQYGIDTSNLLKDYRTDATGALTGAASTAIGTLGAGLTNQLDALGRAQTGALTAGNQAVEAYAPLSALGDTYGRAVSSYYDALGLNGPGGQRRAQATYMQSPGVKFATDAGTTAAINAASRTGNVAGGSTAAALSDRAQGIAAQDYGTQYLDRLAGFVNPQLQATTGAATGISGANKTLADLYQSTYGNIAGAYGANAGATAGLQSGLGGDLSNVFGNYTTGQAQGLKDVAGANAQANRDVAAAGQTDASNLWGLLGAASKAAASAYGGGRA